MNEGRVTANGVDFAYLEQGEGPLVLLLHGFPDNAHTWSAQMTALADAGYRAVAPFMRGYHPTRTPDGAFFDAPTIATDIRALIEALAGEPSFVVGHDWGAAATFYACAAYPETVRRAAALAIAHPASLAARLFDPEVIRRVFHFWFFQMEGLSEAAVAANDFAMIDFFFTEWSPGYDDDAHRRSVKDTLAQPGVLPSALGYYRAMFNVAKQDPATAPVRDAIGTPLTVPMLSILGARDLVPLDHALQKPFHAAEFRGETLDAGHFLHRERPDEVNALLLDWFAS